MPNDSNVYRPTVKLPLPGAIPACSGCGGDSPHGPICGDCGERYRAALEEIANPMQFMRERAKANGDRLSEMAYGIANSVGYLQGIARNALHGGEHD